MRLRKNRLRQFREKLSDETKEKLRQINLGEKHPLFGKRGILSKNSKIVIQVDKNTKQEIACYFSSMDVQRELGISAKHIPSVCKGKRKTAGGFIWRNKHAY